MMRWLRNFALNVTYFPLYIWLRLQLWWLERKREKLAAENARLKEELRS